MSDEFVETAILRAILENDEDAVKQKVESLNMTEAANLDAAARYMSRVCADHWQRLHNAKLAERQR
jgi:hypothetical protein